MSFYVQVTCGRCGGLATIVPPVGGTCPRCHGPVYAPSTPTPVAYDASMQSPHAAASGYQASGYPQASSYPPSASASMRAASPPPPSQVLPGIATAIPPVSKKKAIAGAIALAVVGAGVAGAKGFIKSKQPVPGRATLASLGVADQHAVRPDDLIAAVRPLARRWRSDAEFRGLAIHGLRPDGTVDMASQDATLVVTYYSPSRVIAPSERGRTDSVKDFVFNDDYVTYQTMWGADEPWEGVAPTPVPGCPMATVAAAIPAGKTASLHLDPNWGMVFILKVDGQADRWFALDDCAPVQPGFGE